MTLPLRRLLRCASPALLLIAATFPLFALSQKPNPKLPTLFVVGDFPPTATAGLFDTAHLNIISSSAAGRTTRAYINSGDWDSLLAQVKPGDLVLLEFAPVNLPAEDKAAATRTLQGIGDGTFEYLDPGTRKLELVHSYGWYLRRMVVDTINHGASPILCSPPGVRISASPVAGQANAPTPDPANLTAADWTQAIATEQRVPIINLAAGSRELTAAELRSGLEALQPDPLAPYLKSQNP